MSQRDHQRLKVIVESVIEMKGDTWSDATQKVARTDSLRILEALLAEHGFDGTMLALSKQGFEAAAYGYVLRPLCAEAKRRRGLLES